MLALEPVLYASVLLFASGNLLRRASSPPGREAFLFIQEVASAAIFSALLYQAGAVFCQINRDKSSFASWR